MDLEQVPAKMEDEGKTKARLDQFKVLNLSIPLNKTGFAELLVWCSFLWELFKYQYNYFAKYLF